MSDNQGLTAVPDNLQKLANSLDKARREILEGPSGFAEFVHGIENAIDQGSGKRAPAEYDRSVQDFRSFVHDELPKQIADRLDAQYQLVASAAAKYAALDGASAATMSGKLPPGGLVA